MQMQPSAPSPAFVGRWIRRQCWSICFGTAEQSVTAGNFVLILHFHLHRLLSFPLTPTSSSSLLSSFPFVADPRQNFYKTELNKEEMYIRYIHKLYDLHLKAQNYTGTDKAKTPARFPPCCCGSFCLIISFSFCSHEFLSQRYSTIAPDPSCFPRSGPPCRFNVYTFLFVYHRGVVHPAALWWVAGMVGQASARVPQLPHAERVAEERVSAPNNHPEFRQGEGEQTSPNCNKKMWGGKKCASF